MDKSRQVNITLDFPVQLADRKLVEVTMRRPVMKDMLNHNVGPDSGLVEDMALIAALCGLVPEELEQFDTCDYERLQAQLLRFRGIKAGT
ncbi:phage tail assembly protein [uncultured Desulfovibrio sp.]|uniref:phage tail assembly protein n=1 Tax=uncultured Desulfovibrio sp. TaxID=167968 RepID=UPI0003A495E3|nr:phage tail assembly protein [uncultured Desulfovibrio sp.]